MDAQLTASTRRIVLSDETDGSQDLWLLMLTTEMRHKHPLDTVDPCLCTMTMSSDKSLAIKGPTYKAEVNVDGVRVRVLLDHGAAQVSLVCKELLLKIREKNKWTLDQCHDRNCKVEETLPHKLKPRIRADVGAQVSGGDNQMIQ